MHTSTQTTFAAVVVVAVAQFLVSPASAAPPQIAFLGSGSPGAADARDGEWNVLEHLAGCATPSTGPREGLRGISFLAG